MSAVQRDREAAAQLKVKTYYVTIGEAENPVPLPRCPAAPPYPIRYAAVRNGFVKRSTPIVVSSP
jgi:hypothetical protein